MNIIKNTQIFVKIIAAIFLFLALFTLPIDFYIVVRIVITAVAIYSAYYEYSKSKTITPMIWVYGIIAVIFNPILPFYLGKTIWKITDAITLLVFVGSVYLEIKKFNKNNNM